MGPRVVLTQALWQATVKGLGARSEGRHETACVWTGHRLPEAWSIEAIMFLDDLPGTTGLPRQHRTPRSALDVLFAELRKRELQIIADVHTHPGSWVGLSPVDQSHPIEYRLGLLAVVIPHYARVPVSLADAGIHEYLGAHRWHQLDSLEILQRFTAV